jgi:hypothetical protein
VQRTSGPFRDVPVLVTSGDVDQNVPTAEGRLAARQFPQADVVEAQCRSRARAGTDGLRDVDHAGLHPQPTGR